MIPRKRGEGSSFNLHSKEMERVGQGPHPRGVKKNEKEGRKRGNKGFG